MTDIRVPMPRLLDDNLQEVRRLKPISLQVTANLTSPGEAMLVLADNDEAPPMHAPVEIFTARGSAGIYRVGNVSRTYRDEIQVKLLHGIDTLSDSLWRQQVEFSGTAAQFLTQLLTYQTARINGQAPWVLGRCECAATVERKLNYDRLSALLQTLQDDNPGYMLTYDQSVFPWVVSFVAVPSAVSAEFRLRRNAVGCTVTLDDSDLCNRLRLSASHLKSKSNGTKSADVVYFDYNNTASQAVWGVVEKVADIEVNEDVKAGAHAETDAWAARFLAERAEPSVQIEIDGVELRQLTGDAWDEPQLGEKCRVALPEYGQAVFAERVMSLTWPDAIGDPLRITVSLANNLPKFSETLAQVSQTATRAGRIARRTAQQMEAEESWSLIRQRVVNAADGAGLLALYESGIILDATGGVTIYSLLEGMQALNSVLKITHNGIGSMVTASGVRLDDDGNLVLDPETGWPIFDTGANNLFTQISQTKNEIRAEVVNRQNADTTLASALDLKADSAVLQTVMDNDGQVTAASIATAINAQTGTSAVYISGDMVTISGNTQISDIFGVNASGYLTVAGDIYQNGVIHPSGVSVAQGGTIDFLVGTAPPVPVSLSGSAVQGMIVKAEVDSSTNTLKLWRNGDPVASPSINFSKAATSNVSGAWSGGQYVISANPNGSSLPLSLAVAASVGAVSNVVYASGTGRWYGDVQVTPSVGGTAAATSSTYQIDVQDAVNAGVGAGWTNAAGAVVWPAASTTPGASFGVTVPDTTWNTTTGKTFTLSKSGSWVYANDGSGNVARVACTGSITAYSPVSSKPTTQGAQELRTVTVGTGGNKVYVKISATGYRNSDDYIIISY